jgi:hypothetical protein
LRTLPIGILRGLRDVLLGDLSGFARAATILAGLCVTTGGYLFGVVRGVRDVGRLRDA